MKKSLKNTRKSLKKQLKKTVFLRGSIQQYKPTSIVTAHWFRKLNATLFGNRLGGVQIQVNKLQHDWGRCIANWDNRKTPKGRFNQRIIPYHIPIDYCIQLHCKFPTWKDFIETLAHEMVHLYQMTVIKDPYSNHNDSFYSFKESFKKVGLKLYR